MEKIWSARGWSVNDPRQAQIHEIDELLDSMEKMLGTAVAAIPEDSSIDLKESASKGGKLTSIR